MKKYSIYAFMSAIALTGAVGFSSCSSSSSDDIVINNPDYNPEANSVKTQFSISLPSNVGHGTRMTSDIVQSDDASTTPTFRGMDNIFLIPYSLGSGNVLVGSTANAGAIKLAGFDAFTQTTGNAKVYSSVDLIPGTSNFLIYGKAKDNNVDVAITTATDMFKFGTLTPSGLIQNTVPTLSSVEFTPVSITESKTTVGTALIQALNDVADAVPSEALSDQTTPKFFEVTDAQSSIIRNYFLIYKGLKTASSKSVEAMFDRLYTSLASLTTTATQAGNPNAYKLATAIRSKIDVQRATAGQVALKADLLGYPSELPDGAVRVEWDGTQNKFVAASNMTYGMGLGATLYSEYVYPANLYYWVNSPLKSSTNIQSSNYGSKTWNGGGEDILALYTDGSTVSPNTKSVAVTNQLQYGVARLNATVNALTVTTYYDHADAAVDVTNGFTLTGILIGGQKSVGWDFDVKGTTEYTIYDKTLATGGTWLVKNGQGSSTNYTLALQTAATEAKYVALEFLNNCADFEGADGIIPSGGKFYLVGKLDPTQVTGYSTTTTGKDRVFTQDFKTIVSFTINAGSNDSTDPNHGKGLATATNGIPDLRTSQKELGLSVDMTWQEGLTFTVTM